MLPPIDDKVLQNNPKFAALHKTLTTDILNPNGSTKKHPEQQKRDAVTEALHAHQTKSSKLHHLRTAISTLPLSPKPTKHNPSPSPLPNELIELLHILTLQLTVPNLSAPTIALLTHTPTYASLPTRLPHIGRLLSSHLHTHALALTRLLHPTTNPSFLHRHIPNLALTLSTLSSQISQLQTQLSHSRHALLTTVSILLTLSHTTLTTTITHLERTKHSLISRHQKSTSALLSLSSQYLHLSLLSSLLHAERKIYSSEACTALISYVEHIRDARARLKERGKRAEKELRQYGVGREGEGERKERVMREIARVYGGLVGEVEDVRGDLRRLGGE